MIASTSTEVSNTSTSGRYVQAAGLQVGQDDADSANWPVWQSLAVDCYTRYGIIDIALDVESTQGNRSEKECWKCILLYVIRMSQVT